MANQVKDTQSAAQSTRNKEKAGGLQGSAAPGRQQTHELPPLPFPQDALEPHMSAETLEFHHGKHHKTYVEKLNQLIQGTRFESMGLEEIIRSSDDAIFNNAAQTWNHTFFWNCLSPEGGRPQGEILRALESSFGSFDAFKDKFNSAAAELFGSGWTWLVRDREGRLSIDTSSNADTPITGDKVPLITCDVWEHAYYIDYRNSRPEFLKAYWNIVNWEFANTNFAKSGSR